MARKKSGGAVSRSDTADRFCIIGAGPAGLAAARNLQRFLIPFDGYESHSDVGGLWDITNQRSTVYQSAHLISSKRMTEFAEFPMADDVADYPSHSELRNYFREFARHFGIDKAYRFSTSVVKVEPQGDPGQGWLVTLDTGETLPYRGVLIANGTLSEPNMPTFRGKFSGELLHSAAYKTPDIFRDKRVLIVGAGNSGCDIAVDAVHHARSVDISVRRGYHFVPKYVFGKPADAIGGRINLPPLLKQKVDGIILKWFTGDPERFGFPKPDHALYESHPIVNSLVLYHLGHGDISVKADIERFGGRKVHFVDGSQAEYDIVLLATGYRLHYPFIERRHLNWESGAAPELYLNCFHPTRDNLFVMGMVEASGIGWQGRYEQAELVARYIRGTMRKSRAAARLTKLKKGPYPDMRGGMKYLKLDRMAYYVHKDTYRTAIRNHIDELAAEE